MEEVRKEGFYASGLKRERVYVKGMPPPQIVMFPVQFKNQWCFTVCNLNISSPATGLVYP